MMKETNPLVWEAKVAWNLGKSHRTKMMREEGMLRRGEECLENTPLMKAMKRVSRKKKAKNNHWFQ